MGAQLFISAIVLTSIFYFVQAGLPCSEYGHSCIGGHGKRSSESGAIQGGQGLSLEGANVDVAKLASNGRINNLLRNLMLRRLMYGSNYPSTMDILTSNSLADDMEKQRSLEYLGSK